MNVPSLVSVSIVSPAGDVLRSTETVELPFDARPVNVARRIEDPYEDEAPAGYRPPADPRRWRAGPDATATSQAITDAAAGMRAAFRSIDWSTVPKVAVTATDDAHVGISMVFPERPVGMDHLQPIENPGHGWVVGVRASLDLFTSPGLAPLLDATRGVITLAERVATPVEPA